VNCFTRLEIPALGQICSLWGCKVKILAVLVLIFGLLLPTLAEDIPVPGGTLIIPDGSQITGTFVCCLPPAHGVDFSFADGTGKTWGEANDGDTGFMNFTVPLTSLTINWVGDEEYSFEASGSTGFSCTPTVCPPSGTFTFTGTDITSLSWTNFTGASGVESMTYTLVSTPEPSTLLLLTVSLLLGLSKWAQMSLRKLSRH